MSKLTQSFTGNRRRGFGGAPGAVAAWGRSMLLAMSLVLGGGLVLATSQSWAEESVQTPSEVNINEADAVTLAAALKGVGQSRAQEIVRHRETYGPFASADELTEVKGIGQATLDMNRHRIILK